MIKVMPLLVEEYSMNVTVKSAGLYECDRFHARSALGADISTV